MKEYSEYCRIILFNKFGVKGFAMRTLITKRLPDIRLGLALAAFFGWLLSFPMFGRFLSETAGEKTLVLGLLFVISHAVGLMLLHLVPSTAATSPLPVRSAGGIVAALTVVYAYTHGTLIVDIAVMIILGFTAAYLVLAWVSQLARHTKPLLILAVAMAGANIVFAVTNIPGLLPGRGSFVLLGILALAGVFAFQAPCGREETEELSPRKGHDPVKTIKALAAFVVAIYFVGGIWYHSFALPLSAAPLWEATVGSLIYVGAIIFLAFLAGRGQPGNLAPYSLSALGVGLLIALTGSGRTVIELSFYAALNLGFAAADLFFWYALWFLGRLYGSRRSFGLGLGFSLLLIALSVVLSAIGWPGDSPALLFITALTLLFLAVPFIFRYPFQLFNLVSLSDEDAGFRVADLIPPDFLTPTESRVYTHLMQGASDTEMADELFISKHTVKFHVRNILRKMKVKNRKELLSRHINPE